MAGATGSDVAVADIQPAASAHPTPSPFSREETLEDRLYDLLSSGQREQRTAIEKLTNEVRKTNEGITKLHAAVPSVGLVRAVGWSVVALAAIAAVSVVVGLGVLLNRPVSGGADTSGIHIEAQSTTISP